VVNEYNDKTRLPKCSRICEKLGERIKNKIWDLNPDPDDDAERRFDFRGKDF
jgi:hypothetical protein